MGPCVPKGKDMDHDPCRCRCTSSSRSWTHQTSTFVEYQLSTSFSVEMYRIQVSNLHSASASFSLGKQWRVRRMMGGKSNWDVCVCMTQEFWKCDDIAPHHVRLGVLAATHHLRIHCVGVSLESGTSTSIYNWHLHPPSLHQSSGSELDATETACCTPVRVAAWHKLKDQRMVSLGQPNWGEAKVRLRKAESDINIKWLLTKFVMRWTLVFSCKFICWLHRWGCSTSGWSLIDANFMSSPHALMWEPMRYELT